MKFYLFRHAEKASSGGPNPPLSEGGLLQAKKLSDLVIAGKLPTPQELWVSPKLRTHQTLTPLAQSLGIKLREVPDLIEKQNMESISDFRERIKGVLLEVEVTKQNIFACTHMDWTEEAMSLIPCDTDISVPQYSYWAPAQYMGFDFENGLYKYLDFSAV